MSGSLIELHKLGMGDILSVDAGYQDLSDAQLKAAGVSASEIGKVRESLKKGECFYCNPYAKQPLVGYSSSQDSLYLKDLGVEKVDDAVLTNLQERFPSLRDSVDLSPSVRGNRSQTSIIETITHQFDGNQLDDGESSTKLWLDLYFYQEGKAGETQAVEGVPYKLLLGQQIVAEGTTPANGLVSWPSIRPNKIHDLHWGQPNTSEYTHSQLVPLKRKHDIKMLQDIPLSLRYDDLESTPAGSTELGGEVPYRMTLACGEIREGFLDAEGKAVENSCSACIETVEYYPDREMASLENELEELYGKLEAELNKCAQAMAEGDSAVAKALSPPSSDNKADFDAYNAAAEAAEKKLKELRQLADEHDAKPFYERMAANVAAAQEGIGDGITGYIPDFGELGDILKEVDIDPSVLMSALATGNIEELEKKFKEWENRGKAGFEEASESMEMVILLLADERTRDLIMSLPGRYLEAMPDPYIVRITASQSTQTGIDVGATATATAVGGPAGTAVVGSLTLLRKGGKAAAEMTKVINQLVKNLKIQRAKQKDYNAEDQVSLNHKKNDENKKHVRPTLKLTKPAKKDALAEIQVGIKGNAINEYTGQGTVSISNGGTLYTDKAGTKPVTKTFSKKELKQGQTLYAKLSANKSEGNQTQQQAVTVTHSLSPQKGITVGKDKTINISGANTLWLRLEREPSTIKKNGSSVKDYVALVNGAEQYDFKTAKARTYVDVFLDESEKQYPANLNLQSVTLTSAGKTLLFFNSATDKVAKDEWEIPYQDFSEPQAPNNNSKATQGSQESRAIRVYIEAKKAVEGKVDIIATAKEDQSGNYQLGNSEAKLAIGAEDVDKVLKEDIMADITRSSKGPAIAQAIIHKCGKQTASQIYRNISRKVMDRAMAMFLEHTKKQGSSKGIKFTQYVKVGDNYIPRGPHPDDAPESENLYVKFVNYNFSDDTLSKYLKILEDNLGRKLHSTLREAIKKRLQEYQTLPNGFLSADFRTNPNIGNKAPGFHAEILAVNEILLDYFFKSENKKDLHCITEMTFKPNREDFPACHNCTAILDKEIRVPTGYL